MTVRVICNGEGHMDSVKRHNPGTLALHLGMILIILLLLPACAVDINRVPFHTRGYALPPLETIAAENSDALAWYRENEWQFNKEDKSRPPETCLCLSGGGIRSAAFSMGVFKALHEKGILEKIDIISGVSGGSYALSWYYLRQYGENRKMQDELFSRPYQDELYSKSRMFTLTDMGFSELGNIILLPVNFLFNQVFSFNFDTTVVRRNYESAIRRTFHHGKDLSFPEALELIKKNDLPYFIINTSAAIDYGPSYLGSKLANRVFEFTPLRFGSDGFGYSDEFPVTVGRAVAISAAGVDLASMTPGHIESALASSLNIDLGYHINNFNNTSPIHYLKRIIPFYSLFSHYDKKGTHIYLTDGGHVENLALYPLVRRLCGKIIVVDATFDPDYQFADYHKVKNGLQSEMQVEFEIKEIDQLIHEAELAERNKIFHVSYGNDFSRRPETPTRRSGFDSSAPILHGSISYFPVKMTDNTIEQRKIEVTYIKMSIDDGKFYGFPTNDPMAEVYREARRYYGDQLVQYYLESKLNNNCGELIFGCEFPQYTTYDQDYTSEQFEAYVNLGFHIVRNELSDDLTPEKMVVARSHKPLTSSHPF
jgi:predicted acylesterase/phospholipase RssA